MEHPVFQGLDHLAIVVRNTEEALATWRDRAGLRVLFSEVVNGGAIRLTHLDLGGPHLQLVEPLVANHPLSQWLEERGPGLHHFCFRAADVDDARAALSQQGLTASATPHQGTRGQRALFLDPENTDGVRVEITGR